MRLRPVRFGCNHALCEIFGCQRGMYRTFCMDGLLETKVKEVLLDAEGPLSGLHRRVLEAGCEVAPDWSPVTWFNC